MQALSEIQRAFIFDMIETGGMAPYASYMRCYPGSKVHSAKSNVYRLMHNESIIAAMRVMADRRMRSNALMAMSVIEQIAMNPDHKDQMKAAEKLLGFNGFLVETRHTVNVQESRSTESLLEEVQRLGKVLGIDQLKLMGAGNVALMDTVPNEVQTIEDAELVEEFDDLSDVL